MPGKNSGWKVNIINEFLDNRLPECTSTRGCDIHALCGPCVMRPIRCREERVRFNWVPTILKL